MPMKFVNPYNFVPFEGTCSRGNRESAQESVQHSGMITYSLLTKTPLFIPNTSNQEFFPQSAEYKKKLIEEGQSGKKETDIHRSMDFFSYTDLRERTSDGICYEPVIPGSEIRGMFRNSFEILTNSCCSALDGKNSVLSKRTMTTFQPGLIHRKEQEKKFTYELVKAEDVLWRTKGADIMDDETENWEIHRSDPAFYGRKCYIQSKLKEGEKVSFVYSRRERGKALATFVRPEAMDARILLRNRIYKEGYILKGNDGPVFSPPSNNYTAPPQKHCCHIFLARNTYVHTIDDRDLEKLKRLLEIYEENRKPEEIGYGEYSNQLDEFLSGNGNEYFPVYYSIIGSKSNSILYLSPASKTREVYGASIEKLSGDYAPCSDPAHLCPTCTLFGTLINGMGRPSRLRFTDLYVEKKQENPSEYYMAQGKPVTLKPLSSPKLSNTEFYLKRPDDALYWTYEYYVKNNHVIVSPGILAGRKFYWHNLQVTKRDYANEEVTNQNMTVRPVRGDIIFTGKIYFENLSEDELNKLIYVINAGDSTGLLEKTRGYKLGAAKPLGFGSVACEVQSVEILNYEKVNTYEIKAKKNSYEPFENKQYLKISIDDTVQKNFKTMTDFHAINAALKEKYVYSYPRLEENGDIFEWFSKNHKGWVRIRNTDQKQVSNMPNNREDLLLCEYMEAMQPKLVRTLLHTEPADAAGGRQGGENQQRPRENRRDANPRGRGGDILLKQGEEIEAIVLRHEDRKPIAILQYGSCQIRLHVRDYAQGRKVNYSKELPQGSKVRLKYKGKDLNGYDQWEFVCKI